MCEPRIQPLADLPNIHHAYLAVCIARGSMPIWEIMFSSRLADAFCLLRFVAQLPGALQCTRVLRYNGSTNGHKT